MSEMVRITDVAPRDGLQNEPGVVPTADKLKLIGMLAAAGVDEVEAASFVSPKWVPAMSDAREVVRGIASELLDAGPSPKNDARSWGPYRSASTELCQFSALVPNEKGMVDLLAANRGSGDDWTPGPIVKVGVFTAASETFNRRNTNASVEESIERFRPVIALAREHRLLVRGYISCVVACPFEGPIVPARVAQVASMLLDIGVNEIDLGDTIGAGTPTTVRSMLAEVQAATRGFRDEFYGEDFLTLHLHDTFGKAAECVRTALDLGLRSFDGSAAGLGGCPYASTPTSRAPGNIATEVLVRTVVDAGFRTGVDAEKLAAAGQFAAKLVAEARSRAATGAGAGETKS
jgi:hydroxymethylglutaryl-CoA lyase